MPAKNYFSDLSKPDGGSNREDKGKLVPKRRRFVPTEEDFPIKESRSPGRSSKRMPKNDHPNVNVYLGWDLFNMFKRLCEVWECGPTGVARRLLDPFVDPFREAYIGGAEEFYVSARYSMKGKEDASDSDDTEDVSGM